MCRRVSESGRVAKECKYRDGCEKLRTRYCRPWLLEELQGKKLNNHFCYIQLPEVSHSVRSEGSSLADLGP
jgi:hypothetical protein